MPIKSDNTKGNPYHDERNGEFTSKDGANSVSASTLFDTPDDFLKSFDVDNVDDFLNSLDSESAEEKNGQKNISEKEWKDTLDSLITNKNKKSEFVQKLSEIYQKCPQDVQNLIFYYFNATKTPINIKGQKTQFVICMNGWGEVTRKEIFYCKNRVFSQGEDGEYSIEGLSAFVHEPFHGIDDFFDDASKNYVLSNKKTFKQTFESEIPSTIEGKQKLFSDLMNDFENEAQKNMIKNGFSQEDYLLFKKIQNKTLEKELTKQLNEEAKKVDKNNQDEVESFKQKVLAKLNQVSEFKANFNSLMKIYKKTKEDFRPLSDISESIDSFNKFTAQIGCGHGEKYWENGEKQIKEVFAEVAQSYAMMPKSLEYMQKYFPKTIEAFKEILGGLNNGTRKE